MLHSTRKRCIKLHDQSKTSDTSNSIDQQNKELEKNLTFNDNPFNYKITFICKIVTRHALSHIKLLYSWKQSVRG